MKTPLCLGLLFALTASGYAQRTVPEGLGIEIAWSGNPGCFERHLQRKYGNPFFPPASRVVRQEEVDSARDRDRTEAMAFRGEYVKVLRQFVDLEDIVPVSVVMDQLEQLDDLILRASELGGEVLKEQEKMIQLFEGTLAELRTAVNREQADGLQELEEATSYRWKLFLNAFVAQMNRPNTPITAEEVVPSMLTEDPKTIQLVMSFLDKDKDRQERVRWLAVRLLLQVSGEGHDVPQLREKLRALGARP